MGKIDKPHSSSLHAAAIVEFSLEMVSIKHFPMVDNFDRF